MSAGNKREGLAKGYSGSIALLRGVDVKVRKVVYSRRMRSANLFPESAMSSRSMLSALAG
jgi:hypothetical protein